MQLLLTSSIPQAITYLASAFPVASLRVMFGLPVISSPMRCAITFSEKHISKNRGNQKQPEEISAKPANTQSTKPTKRSLYNN